MNRKKQYPGVLIIGRMSYTGGYAAIISNYLRAMDRVNIRYAAIDSVTLKFICKKKDRFGTWDEKNKTFSTEGDLVVIINEVPTDFDKVKVNGRVRLIGCTLFETHSFPAYWFNYIDLVDEVWVPTRFNLKTFSSAGIPREKLRVVSYCLDTNFFNNTKVEPYRIYGVREFVFLYILSNLNRKDVGMLLRAYYQGFKDNKDTTLILKLVHKSSDELEQIKASVQPEFDFDDPRLPHVVIIQDKFDDKTMKRLYQLCDVYVSTERAKGWDFPAMEAMAMGKPVVSIDWSGSTEFLNHTNSFLIPHQGNMIDIDEDLVSNQPLYFNQLWPDVRDEDVGKVLVRSYMEKDLRKEYGSRGQKEIKGRYSPEVIGNHIKKILNSYNFEMMRGKENASVKVDPFCFTVVPKKRSDTALGKSSKAKIVKKEIKKRISDFIMVPFKNPLLKMKLFLRIIGFSLKNIRHLHPSNWKKSLSELRKLLKEGKFQKNNPASLSKRVVYLERENSNLKQMVENRDKLISKLKKMVGNRDMTISRQKQIIDKRNA